MEEIELLRSRHGANTRVCFDPRNLGAIAEDGIVDAVIVATEDGFSPLGRARQFFACDLGIPVDEIRQLARWNFSENERVTLVALASRRSGSRLKGILLAPCENSRCYERFATPFYGRPYRDFYYNISYEAIAYAHERWGARHIAMSHLSASGKFHEDIATCSAEALAHFCDSAPAASVESFVFGGCCISSDHLKGVSRLNVEGERTAHRPISVSVERDSQADRLHLNWPGDSREIKSS